MLETVDLDARLPKAEFKPIYEQLEIRLSQLQRAIRDAGIPVVVVMDGWAAAGIGTATGRILNSLDPRGYKLHNTGKSSEEESLRPPLWRYWVTLPKRGAIAVYDGSWYDPILQRGKPERGELESIRSFERQLTDDGTVVVKFWLHISKDEQAKRFKRIEKIPSLSWKVTKRDWKLHRQYEEHLALVEDMLNQTSTANAPWTLIPSHDQRYAAVRVAESLIAAIEAALASKRSAKGTIHKLPPRRTSPLDSVDLSLVIEREEYERRLSELQDTLLHLEHDLYLPRIPVVIVYEGWDASGKGGNIKRLVSGLDHRGVEVIPIGPPEGDEKTHHYLWRFWKALPKGGHIAIFDRSWYGRVLVERIEKFARPDEWQRAYREINEFEKALTDFGTVVVKFWIHISKDEQLRRFKSREQIPYKQWKITPDDWRNRRKWNAYYEAVSDMIERTSTANAPWTIIEGNQKLHARIKALETVIKAIEAALDKGKRHLPS